MRLGTAAALALALAGCSADYVEQNQSSVLLLVESINEGAPLLSDVNVDGTVVNCEGTVAVSVRAKNPGNPVTPVNDVRVLRYEVSYRRSDGRGVPGVDVPYTISGNLTATFSESSSTERGRAAFSRATDSGTSSITSSGILNSTRSTNSIPWNSAIARMTSSPVA